MLINTVKSIRTLDKFYVKETKLMQIDDSLCTSLWGNSPHGYSFRPSIGASGGLLIMWDKEEVEILASYSFAYVLAVRGRFLKTNDEFIVYNVYAPCDVRSQHVLWESLFNRLANNDGACICICGDFNVVRGGG